MNELALFAGAGGGILGGHLLGWRTVCAVEWEQYPASVLCARQNDKILPTFPIWDDVQTFDGNPWRGIVDVVSGGFPCQDISAAGGGLESPEKEVQCGNTWRELLAKYNPDTALWKTAQCSLLEDLEQSLEIWPRWGLMRNGECYRQPMLVQIILEKESGLSQKINWPTPTCQDANKATKKYRENHQNNLTAMVFNPHKMFPTPTSRDYKGGYRTESLFRKDGKSRALDTLPNAVLDGKGTETVIGHLNPTWVEWLMGWPQGWTDLKPLEMDKSLYVQQQHGNC